MITFGGLEWFLSIKAECSNVEIIFMHPNGSDDFSTNQNFIWPIRENICLVLFEHIQCIMNNINSPNSHWSFTYNCR